MKSSVAAFLLIVSACTMIYADDELRVNLAAFILPAVVHVFNAEVVQHRDGSATITGLSKK